MRIESVVRNKILELIDEELAIGIAITMPQDIDGSEERDVGLLSRLPSETAVVGGNSERSRIAGRAASTRSLPTI